LWESPSLFKCNSTISYQDCVVSNCNPRSRDRRAAADIEQDKYQAHTSKAVSQVGKRLPSQHITRMDSQDFWGLPRAAGGGPIARKPLEERTVPVHIALETLITLTRSVSPRIMYPVLSGRFSDTKPGDIDQRPGRMILVS